MLACLVQSLASWEAEHTTGRLQAVELQAPRAGSAPAFLHTSAPLGGYGGYGASMGHGMYSSPYGTAFNTGVRQDTAVVQGLLHACQGILPVLPLWGVRGRGRT